MLNRVERLTATLLLLQERKRTADAIGRELGVARRTVLRDVQSLSAMGVPILGQSGPNGGYEIDRESTLAPLHLTWREALLLLLAVDALAKMSDTPFLADRASLQAKLHALLPASQRSRVEALLGRVGMEIPARPQRTPYLDRLLELCGAWAKISYGGRMKVVRIDRLYADRGFWYVAGVSEGKSRTFRADRISEAVACDAPIDATEPLPYGHASHPLVKVRLTEEGARRVQADPHLGPHAHGPGLLEFRCPPEELEWYARFFVGLGEDAIVEGPAELLVAVRTRVQTLRAHYGS